MGFISTVVHTASTTPLRLLALLLSVMELPLTVMKAEEEEFILLSVNLYNVYLFKTNFCLGIAVLQITLQCLEEVVTFIFTERESTKFPLPIAAGLTTPALKVLQSKFSQLL